MVPDSGYRLSSYLRVGFRPKTVDLDLRPAACCTWFDWSLSKPTAVATNSKEGDPDGRITITMLAQFPMIHLDIKLWWRFLGVPHQAGRIFLMGGTILKATYRSLFGPLGGYHDSSLGRKQLSNLCGDPLEK